MTKSRSQLLLVAAALVAAGGAALWHALQYWTDVDDAFIAFRYADNLASGLGPVFNRGERVEGYTDFLWVALLALLRLLRAGETPETAQRLGALFGALAIPATYLAGRRVYRLGPFAALLPCAVVAASADLAMWTGAGLETALYTALFTTALAAWMNDLASSPRYPLSGPLFALAALTRPEAAGLFAAALFLAAVLEVGQRRTLLAAAAGFGALFLPHLVFRLAYYGYPLPNTFYAKTGLNRAMLEDGLSYAGEFFLAHGVWALPALVGLAAAPRGRAERTEMRRGLLPPAVLGVAVAYVIWAGGDIYPYHRFLATYLPWLCVCVCAGAARLAARAWAGAAWAPPAVAGLAAASMAIPGKLWPDSLFRGAYDSSLCASAGQMRSYGEWLGRNFPKDAVLAVSSLGRIPFYSKLQTIDMLGLADVHIAHRKMELTRGIVGHQKYDSEYLLARRPDLVAIEVATLDRDFDPAVDLDTEKLFQRILPDKGFWPAPSDLVARREFRLDYEARAAEVEPGVRFLYFARDPGLRQLMAKVPADSPDPRDQFELAMALRRRGLLDDALASMKRSALADPTSANAAIALGFLLCEAGRIQECLAQFQSAAAAFPDQPYADYGMAYALQKLGRFREAEPLWTRFLRRAPQDRFAVKAQAFLATAARSAK
jgi:arabinofuranosyltransferase